MIPTLVKNGIAFPGNAGEEIAGKIWDSIKSGLILVDSEGKILLWNDWVALHSGIPAEFALNRFLESLFPDGLSASFKAALKNVLQRKLPIILSNALHRSPLPLYPLPVTQHKQGRIQQSIVITPIVTSKEKYLCLIQIADATLSVKRERVLKSHTERLSKEAITDALTGAYNRRFFDERFAAEFGRALRQNVPLSLIMLDVDYFKPYNDKYGHPAGDRVLISVVQALKSQLNRPTDVVARYGGEEFAIILPDSGPEGGQIVAEKLRLAVSELNIPHDESAIADHITISVGITTYQPDTICNATCFLETADTALYSAKHSGRNCVRYIVTPDCSRPCPDTGPQADPSD
ncbi:GGDEF domain-containing protein [Candidatus Ferrigenium straubiae]|jgi:diguanylate cyclase (GGDEF)-like protein|uniref:GGDEF domain-containing protein n=1 Tax=Candidatus Ferrigenium straubiae TaxID=2919506 RepID=UPI003F4ACFB4